MKVVELLEIVEQTPTQLVLRQGAGLNWTIMILSWAFGFLGAPLIFIFSQEDKPWKIPFLVAMSFLGIIVFVTLVFAFRVTTYIFDKQTNTLTIKRQILLSTNEKKYSFNEIQQIGIGEYFQSEPYVESWDDFRQGKVRRTSYYAVLKTPSEEIMLGVSSQRLPLVHSPVIQSLCGFLSLPLEELELK